MFIMYFVIGLAVNYFTIVDRYFIRKTDTYIPKTNSEWAKCLLIEYIRSAIQVATWPIVLLVEVYLIAQYLLEIES